MPIPDFVLDLRRHVGHAPLGLVGVTAVVVRGEEVLLVRRADTAEWAPVTGIVEPGEQPAHAAVRETLEETTVAVAPRRLASVRAQPLHTHVNGDQVYYLDHTFECVYLAGEPAVGDDESIEVRWWPLAALPRMQPEFRERIGAAQEQEAPTRFRL